MDKSKELCCVKKKKERCLICLQEARNPVEPSAAQVMLPCVSLINVLSLRHEACQTAVKKIKFLAEKG